MRDPVSVARLPIALIAGILLLCSVGAAQLRRPVPMPPNLFNIIKLNDHLYIIAPSGPDTSNVGGNIGVCIADEGVLLVDANYNLDWRNGQAVPMAQSVVNEVKKLTPSQFGGSSTLTTMVIIPAAIRCSARSRLSCRTRTLVAGF